MIQLYTEPFIPKNFGENGCLSINQFSTFLILGIHTYASDSMELFYNRNGSYLSLAVRNILTAVKRFMSSDTTNFNNLIN